MTFANPQYLYGLAIVPLLVAWYIMRNSRHTSDLQYSSLRPFAGIKPTMKERLRHLPFILRMLVITMLLVGVARPRTTSSGENVYTEGIDIVLLFDISGSMLAEDLRPNRIEAARQVMMDFVDGRTNDRIGLVIFAGESFTQCPMTLDYRVLKNQLRTVKQGVIEDGTAIGMAIAQGVNRLKESKSASKVIILLTDGINNRGEIDPVTATQIAQTFGIRMYTIGVGTSAGQAPFPVQTPFGTRYQNMTVDVDEKTLTKIAEMTGGQYFRATDNRSLKWIYQEIDEMEKTRIEVRSYRSYTELFYGWAWIGLFAMVMEMGLGLTYLRKLP
ncbi:MAG: VWA domain-containing protein [Bacteroidetes bacterium]|nr:VWA domain-containing protein [Bacteroidota bacterium]MCW5895867.1 VWA domain-containing protein [Bacteroidota bacterium]